MNDKFKLRKNVRFSVVSFAINIALVFFSYRLVISFEGIESVGIWSLLMAWGALIRIGDVGMGNATLRFVAMKNLKDEALLIRKYIDTGIAMNFVIFLFLTLITYFILNRYLDSIVSSKSMPLAQTLLPIMLTGIFFSTLTSVLLGSLQGLHYGYMGSYLTVGGNLLQIIFVFLMVPEIGVLGLAWAQLIRYIIMVLAGLYFLSIKVGEWGGIINNISIPILREMLGFSLKAQIANVTNGLFEPVSKIIINQFGGLQEQGLYELAYKTVSLSRNAVATGLFASLPTITNMINDDMDKARELYSKSQKNVTKAIALAMVLIFIFSPLVSIIWMGHFDSSYWFFIFFIAAGFWINTIGATAYNLGLATGQMKSNIISSFITLIVLVIFGYTLGFFYSVSGVGIAVGLSLAIGGIIIKFLNEKLLY